MAASAFAGCTSAPFWVHALEKDESQKEEWMVMFPSGCMHVDGAWTRVSFGELRHSPGSIVSDRGSQRPISDVAQAYMN